MAIPVLYSALQRRAGQARLVHGLARLCLTGPESSYRCLSSKSAHVRGRNHARMAAMMDAYLPLIATLQVPSVEQTERFVLYVAGVHSWYKHLPVLPPGYLFTFFLDPNAGRSLVCTVDCEKFVDRTDEEERFHHSWMLTAEYLEKFGHWNYAANAGPGLRTGSAAEGWAISPTPRPRVMTSDGSWVELSTPVIEAGSCSLTAMVHASLNPNTWLLNHGPDMMENFKNQLQLHPDDPELVRYAKVEAIQDLIAGEYVCVTKPLEEFHRAEVLHQREKIRQALFRVRALLRN